MRYPSGNLVFRVLVGVLMLELAYVAFTILRPDGPPPHRDPTHSNGIVIHETQRPAPATPVAIARVTPGADSPATGTPAPSTAPSDAATAMPTATATPTDDPPSPTPAPAATATPADVHRSLPAINALTYMDDDKFTYEGRWEHVRGRSDGRRMGTSSRSFHPGDTSTFTFKGRFVILFGVVGPGGGQATIDIDQGHERGAVDFDSRIKKLSALVYESSVLANGPHTVRITVQSVRGSKGRGPGYVNIDGAYYGT